MKAKSGSDLECVSCGDSVEHKGQICTQCEWLAKEIEKWGGRKWKK